MSQETAINGAKCPTHITYNAVSQIPAVLEDDFVYPNTPSRCTWNKNKINDSSAHSKRPL